VVRAGGDGYLLKNGPARHLVDAISYVQDGGQYFSPQLRRDGRDRHLLEEPPRYADVDAHAANRGSGERSFEQESRPETERRSSMRDRSSRVRRGRRASDPRQLRERIREESGGPDLSDRDYEIMSMMADGIRPILDRLDEIDNRVAQMEEGDEPVPSNPRGWLTHELADTLGADNRIATLNGRGSASDLEARLPEMIEEAVTARFNQMAGKLQQEIEETHVRTLETFVKNIQVKLVQRVSALEQDMSKQAEAMNQLREYSQRTEDNLSRLISGVDRLAHELPKRLAAAQQESSAMAHEEAQRPVIQQEEPVTIRREPVSGVREATAPPASPRPIRRKQPSGKSPRRFIIAVMVAVAVLGLAVWGVVHFFLPSAEASQPQVDSAPGTPAKSPKRAPLPANADTKTKLQAAQQYSDSKDYAMAEDIYKHIVADDPGNVEALKGLASVLYREGKVDESADVLDKIPRN